jgi:glycosyltransferase involved in cell wall biosynthesis
MSQPQPEALRVVHLAAHDGRGGAARAVRRLHAGLGALGLHSRLFVRERFSAEPGICAVAPGDGAAHARAARRIARELERHERAHAPDDEPFHGDRAPLGAQLLDALPDAHVYNLHWVGGFVDWGTVLPALARRAPVVFTLSDLNAITGGCHYDLGCGRYRDACGACPRLGSRDPADLSAAVLARKRRALAAIAPGRLQLVAASRWLAERIRESRLGRDVPTLVIPRAVDTARFRPRDRAAARRRFGLGDRERVALFVSTRLTNRRKGIEHALGAAESLRRLPGFRLVCAGFGPGPEPRGLPVLELGHVADDERMAELLSAADVLLAPALQEAFGLAVLEALSCGTPVVAFDTGAAPDLVKPGVHGFVVPVGDVRAMSQAAHAVLLDDSIRARMGRAARELALEGYGLEQQARRYQDLYRSMLGSCEAAG